jgi:hypothetical protein
MNNLVPRLAELPLPLAGEGGEGAAEVRLVSAFDCQTARSPSLPSPANGGGKVAVRGGNVAARGERDQGRRHTTISRTCFARAVQAPMRKARSVPVET